MDKSSGSKTGQSTFDAIPKTQGVSSQYNTPQPTQQTINPDPFEDYFKGTQNNGNQKMPVTLSQTSQPQKQPPQIPPANQSEQGSAPIIMDEDDKDDRTQVTTQQVTPTEAPTPIAQLSHPEVLIKKELDEIVKPGPDAKRKDLPEEPERLGDIVEESQTQKTTEQIDKDALPMTYGEAMLAKRKERSIKKGISWIVRGVIRQWKQRFITVKKQESKEQAIN